MKAVKNILLFLALTLLHFSAPALALFQEAPEPPPTFLQQHWWEGIVIVLLMATCFAHLEEDRTGGAVFYFLLTLAFLFYCLYKTYAPHY